MKSPVFFLLLLVLLLSSCSRKGEDMKANYEQGCSYAEKGMDTLALRHFHRAIEASDTNNRRCDYQTLSRVYAEMGKLFRKVDSPARQLQFFRLSEKYALKANDSLSALEAEREKGEVFYELNILDSALICLESASLQYLAHGDTINAFKSHGTLSLIYLNKGDTTKAEKNFSQYEIYANWVERRDTATANAEKAYVYYRKGLYHEALQQLDSAENYYRRLTSVGDDFNYYRGLKSIYTKKNVNDSIEKYSQPYTEAYLEYVSEINSIQFDYDYNHSEEVVQAKRMKWRTFIRIVLCFIVINLIIGLVLFFKWKREQQRAREKLIKANIAYSDTLQQYTTLRQEMENLLQDKETFIKDKEEKITQLQALLSQYNRAQDCDEAFNIDLQVLNAEIVQQLHKFASRGLQPTDKHWEELNQFIDTIWPAFKSQLLNLSANLTLKEMLICLLSKLRFLPSEISILLGISPQRLTNMRAALNQKLFNQSGAKSFDERIKFIKTN